MKKLLALVLALASGSLLHRRDGRKGSSWASSPPTRTMASPVRASRTARAEAEALKAAGVIEDYMMGVGGEASKQIQAIDDILAWGPDAIMLWPLEGDQLRNAAQTVVDEGVPLIIYDRLIENFKGMAAEIMGDNEKIGNMMGEYLLKYFDAQLKAGETLNLPAVHRRQLHRFQAAHRRHGRRA